MKCPRLRGRWPWLGLLLAPVLAWAVVLALAPTEWAKARLVARLTGATGRSVRIGALRLGFLGDLRVLDLSIAEKGSPADPWIRVAEARMDVHLGQILCGHCEPREVELEGVSVRVWRRKDGSHEFGDLVQTGKPTGTHHGAGPEPSHGGVNWKVARADVRFIDEPSGTLIDLTGVEAKGSSGRRMVAIDEMQGRLNGGSFVLAAKLDRDPVLPRFEAEVRAVSVRVDSKMPTLGTLIPVVAGATCGSGGRLSLHLRIVGQGKTRADLRRSTRGNGMLVIDPIDLEDSKFLAELDILGDWSAESRVGSVATDFTIERGRITTDDLTIRLSRFPFVLGGWTDFDGRFDYAPQVDRIAAQLPREARGLIPELKLNFDQLAGLRIRGSSDRVEVTVNGHPLTGDPDRPDDERARFRDTARRIRDRFFR